MNFNTLTKIYRICHEMIKYEDAKNYEINITADKEFPVIKFTLFEKKEGHKILINGTIADE